MKQIDKKNRKFKCHNCKKTFTPRGNQEYIKFCSKTCNNEFNRKIKAEKLKETNKQFKKTIKITKFSPHPKKDIKLSISSILNQEDKTMLGGWVRKAYVESIYIDRDVGFWRNGSYVKRTIPTLALSLSDIQVVINFIERRFKKTGRIILRDTIKKVKEFRKLWIKELKNH